MVVSKKIKERGMGAYNISEGFTVIKQLYKGPAPLSLGGGSHRMVPSCTLRQ